MDFFYYRLLFKPIGSWFGLKDFRISYQRHDGLESAYQLDKKPSDAKLKELSEQYSLSVRYVSNWIRKRRNKDKSSILTKFCESGWRLMFYVVACIYGFLVLKSKTYFWDTKDCWRSWPHQHVSSDIFWYYMIELGYYWAALISVFSDVKRKDFKQMLLHHLVTIWLLIFSWITNFVRIGSLVLLVHDLADPWMESAKMSKYIQMDKMCTFFFFGLMVLWFLSRLVLYPVWILNTTFFQSLEIMAPFPAYHLFNGALFILQILHVIWFYFVLLLAYELCVHGEIRKDTRSESEASLSEPCESNGSTSPASKKKS